MYRMMGLIGDARDIWTARGGIALSDASGFSLGMAGMAEPEAKELNIDRKRYT